MARRRQIGQGRPSPIHNQQAAETSWVKTTLRRVVIIYVLFATLFTCPYPNGNPVCKLESFAHSTLVAPISNYLLQTETGARVNTAFNAHLVPFYRKHGAPIVGGVNSFAVNTAGAFVKKAASPVCDAFHRAADPHIEKVASVYTAHAKPAVDAVENVVGGTARNYVVPVLVVAKDQCVKVVDNYAVPFFKSAVNEHVVPFFTNHVQPRWKTQVKPALGHYSKVAVDYTRSSVLPNIADGGAHGYQVSRDFASTHIVPRAKKFTVSVYVFVKNRVFPPVYSVYASTLKPHVDRVVPWDKVDSVTQKTGVVLAAVFDVCTSFFEELFYMGYTICTGKEHPAVVERLRQSQMLIEDSYSAVTSSSELPLVTEHAGQIKNFARKMSGSARQWVQIARGWVGSAVEVAKDGMATYASRMSATVEEQFSMATEAANVATEAIVEKASEIQYVVSSATEAAAEFVAEDSTTAASQSIVSSATAEPIMVVQDQDQQLVEKDIQEDEEETQEDEVEDKEEEDEVQTQEQGQEQKQKQKPEQGVEQETADNISTIASAASEAVVEDFEHITSNVAEAVTKAVSDIKSEAADVVSTVSDAIVDKIEPFAETVGPISHEIKESVDEMINSVTEPAAAIVHEPSSAIVDRVSKDVEQVKDQAASVVESATEKLEPVAQSVAEIPEVVKSLAQEVLEETTESLAVPTLEAPEVEVPVIEIAADKAASVIYEARDAMAGVVVQEEDKALFEELVNSASDKVGNLEAFPSIVSDADGADSQTAEEAQTESSSESSQAETPAAVKREQAVSESDPLPVAEKQEVPVVEKLVEKIESVVEAFAIPEITPEPKEEEKTPSDGAESESESESEADGDVRRSASNWVKDARMSISKEIAEERTRAVSQAFESFEDISDVAESEARVVEVPEAEVPVPIEVEAPAESEAEAKVNVPVENAVPVEQKTEPVAIVVSTSVEEKPVAAKTVNESPVPPAADGKPSVTENANPVVAPVKRAKPADAASASASATGASSSHLSSDSLTKGPRKIKKTKKRVVKKAASPAASVDATATSA
ncbi:hypothetical protein H4R99_006618 [Coemansia sp. RSA 1722]|nr:hypothetical protein H4R99_006618 [Coemansia sp. RSA 1722]